MDDVITSAPATKVTEYILSVSDNKLGMLASVRTNGTVEYGKGYEPDKTARVFWEAIARIGLFAWADQRLANIAATAMSLVPPHEDNQLGPYCQCLTCSLFRQYAEWKIQKLVPGDWHLKLAVNGELKDASELCPTNTPGA